MPDLNDILDPDMQRILLFLLPLLGAIGSLVMNMSRGFSTAGTVLTIAFGLVAIYFAPGFLSVF